jgi:hypothetical protein
VCYTNAPSVFARIISISPKQQSGLDALVVKVTKFLFDVNWLPFLIFCMSNKVPLFELLFAICNDTLRMQ